MNPIEIIRAVNGKALTVRAALQIIRHQKEAAKKQVLEINKKKERCLP